MTFATLKTVPFQDVIQYEEHVERKRVVGRTEHVERKRVLGQTEAWKGERKPLISHPEMLEGHSLKNLKSSFRF